MKISINSFSLCVLKTNKIDLKFSFLKICSIFEFIERKISLIVSKVSLYKVINSKFELISDNPLMI